MIDNKNVIKVDFNWRQESDSNDAGENYDTYEVGINGVISITEHSAQGEGDKWNYLIEIDGGGMFRIFNPNFVVYGKEIEK